MKLNDILRKVESIDSDEKRTENRDEVTPNLDTGGYRRSATLTGKQSSKRRKCIENKVTKT